MFSFIALTFTLGGLVLIGSAPWLGMGALALGFAAGIAAVKRRDDLDGLAGAALLLILVVGAVRGALWLIGR